MRKSSIQLMRKSRITSLDQSSSLIHESSFNEFQKTNFGQRLTVKDTVIMATEKVLDKHGTEKGTTEPVPPVWTQQRIQNHNKTKIPEYEFLKSKDEVQADPFLKAKQKYLVTKQKPQLISQMPKLKLPVAPKRNRQNIENESGSLTTFRKEFTKENKKKLFLLTVANIKK